MGKQFRFFLVPSDVESLLTELCIRFGVRMVAPHASSPCPDEISSPYDKCPSNAVRRAHSYIHCYLLPPDADVKMWYVPEQNHWAIDDERSEVIQFTGCEYDGKFLEIGRFYFRKDMLIGDTIWLKRKEFYDWANKIFRFSKKQMRYSSALDAYVGEKADLWRKDGGRFAYLIRADGIPNYAEE